MCCFTATLPLQGGNYVVDHYDAISDSYVVKDPVAGRRNIVHWQPAFKGLDFRPKGMLCEPKLAAYHKLGMMQS